MYTSFVDYSLYNLLHHLRDIIRDFQILTKRYFPSKDEFFNWQQL